MGKDRIIILLDINGDQCEILNALDFKTYFKERYDNDFDEGEDVEFKKQKKSKIKDKHQSYFG